MSKFRVSSSILLHFILFSMISCGSESTGVEPRENNNNNGNNGNNGGGDATSALDIIVVNAIGTENSNTKQINKAHLDQLMAALNSEMGSNAGARLALIASPTASISEVPLSLSAFNGVSADRLRQINFEIATKDAFIGTLVAGCAQGDSNLDEDQHAAGTVTVCKKTVSVPAHSWTWANQDLLGTLSNFLRPGAKRVYIFVASNDALLVAPNVFMDIAGSQNKGIAPRVFTIAPTNLGGNCNSQNKVASNFASLASLSSGGSFSYCDQNWNTQIQQIVSAL